jgi:hypothetical protein
MWRPGVVLCREAGAGAHGTRAVSGAALSREVGTGVAVTRGAPRAALRGPRATLSQEVGTGAVVTRGAPRVALRREAGATPELPRAGPLLAVSGDFFLVASHCPTKHNRV